MKHLALVIALVLGIPSADAAVIATTKQKKLPVIENVRVAADGKTFGFDVKKAPNTDAYDIWARITGGRNRPEAEWFVRSMKLRTRAGIVADATFAGNPLDMLAYAKKGTYQLTMFACPANANDDPTEKSCAHASVGLVKK